jgi:hypothetical protein
MTRSVPWFVSVCFVTVFAFAAGATLAQESESDETGQAEAESGTKLSPLVLATGGKGGTSTKVYTNEDLKKMHSGELESPTETTPSSSAPAKKTDGAEQAQVEQPAPTKSALDQMFEREAARKEHDQKIADAEQAVTDAKQRVVDLEKRLLAIRNPLLARPGAPEEGADEWERGNGQQRVKMTEEQTQAAREAVAQAERELAELRRTRP